MTTTKTKTARRMTEKQVERVLIEYDLNGKLEAFLLSLGEYAYRVPSRDELWPMGQPEGARRPSAALRAWVVLTRAGMLGVSGDPEPSDSIMCVFDDPKEASRHVDATVPSGKWNHHAFVGHCHGPTSREDMLHKLDQTWATFVRDITELTAIEDQS